MATQLGDKNKTFRINKQTWMLTCPDGSVKQLKESGCDEMGGNKNNIELYAEWNDIGIFYYTFQQIACAQGQHPTYDGDTLDDIIILFE